MKINWKYLCGLVLAFALGVWISNVSVIRMTAEAWAWYSLFAGFFLCLATATGDPDNALGAMLMSVIGGIVSLMGIFQPMNQYVDFFQTVFVVLAIDTTFIVINLINKFAIWMKARKK